MKHFIRHLLVHIDRTGDIHDDKSSDIHQLLMSTYHFLCSSEIIMDWTPLAHVHQRSQLNCFTINSYTHFYLKRISLNELENNISRNFGIDREFVAFQLSVHLVAVVAAVPLCCQYTMLSSGVTLVLIQVLAGKLYFTCFFNQRFERFLCSCFFKQFTFWIALVQFV